MTILLIIYAISLIISSLIYTWIIYDDGCTLSQLIVMIIMTLLPITNTIVSIVVIFWAIFYEIRDKLEIQIITPKSERNQK